MSNFINRLVSRNIQTDHVVKPRLKGRFETGEASFGEKSAIEQENSHEINNKRVILDPISGKEDQSRENQTFFHETTSPSPQILETKAKSIQPFSKFESRDLPSLELPEIKIKNSNNQELSPLILPEKQNSEQESVFKAEKSSDSIPQNIILPVFPSPKSLPSRESEQSNRGSLSLITNPSSFSESKMEKQTPPTIKVTIGRIEVRTQSHSPTPIPIRKRQTIRPNMSLDDYLKKRNNPHQ